MESMKAAITTRQIRGQFAIDFTPCSLSQGFPVGGAEGSDFRLYLLVRAGLKLSWLLKEYTTFSPKYLAGHILIGNSQYDGASRRLPASTSSAIMLAYLSGRSFQHGKRRFELRLRRKLRRL
jgi:hypothetical protein